MRFLKSLATLVGLSCGVVALAQGPGVDQLKQQFAAYQQRALEEELYLHTDKNTYVAGDILWFKVYYVDAAQHKPLHLSKVAYVEVLDKDNKPLVQAKVALESSGSGSLQLPLGTATANYKLRAYTAWMKNFGADHFFETSITIINTLKNLEPASDTALYAVQVFPEGGNLVNNLQSNVAVEVTGAKETDIDFTGTVVTETGDSVASFRSLKSGTGRFSFTPLPEHSYQVLLRLPNGRTLKKEVPKAYAQGVVMQLKNAGSALSIAVATSKGSTDRNVYVLAHNHQKIEAAQVKVLENGQALFTIDTAALAPGITYITIFNEARQPVCERLYFKKPAQVSTVQVTADNQQYGTRQKVALTINLKNSDPATLPDLSLAVFKKDVLQDAGHTDINSYLWLTSELNGRVAAPGYYFSNDAVVAEATDNLMLTHGWRRFRWEQVARTPAFPFPPEVSGQLLKALVTNASSGQPAPNINTFLSVPGSPFQFLASQSDSSGAALFELKNQYGPGSLIFQTNTTYDSGYRIVVQPPFAQTFTPDFSPAYTFSKAHADALLQQSIGMQVQHLYRGDSISRFAIPAVYDTVPFYGRPDYSYMLDAYTRFPTIEEVLREYVRPINVVQRRGALHLLIFDDVRKRFFDDDELVLLDGIPLFHKDVVFALDPLKMKKLDVITRKYYMGANFFNGVASFTSYNGNYEGLQLDPNAVVLDYEGLQLEREFYAPVYETAQQAQSRVPDFRSTLLWQPHVDVKGTSATLSFYTSDVKGNYVVAVEGLDAAGNPCTAQLPIEVK